MFSYYSVRPLRGETYHGFINRQMKQRGTAKQNTYKQASLFKRLFGRIESDLNDEEIRAIYDEAALYRAQGLLT